MKLLPLFNPILHGVCITIDRFSIVDTLITDFYCFKQQIDRRLPAARLTIYAYFYFMLGHWDSGEDTI